MGFTPWQGFAWVWHCLRAISSWSHTRAEFVLAGDIAVLGADGEDGRDGDIGQAEIGQRAAHQTFAGLGAGDLLAHVEVQHGPAGVSALERLLHLQGLEGIVREAHRNLGAVGVIGRSAVPAWSMPGKRFWSSRAKR